MKDINEMVEELVANIEDMPADTPVYYEVWAIGNDREDQTTDTELIFGTFTDPDQAVAFAKELSAENVHDLAADCDYSIPTDVSYVSIEVETVVPDDEGGTMNIGTIYKKTIELFAEPVEFIALSNDEFEVIEETGYIQVPCSILKNYNKNDLVTIIFDDEEQPWPITYKIISETTSGHYVCEFV